MSMFLKNMGSFQLQKKKKSLPMILQSIVWIGSKVGFNADLAIYQCRGEGGRDMQNSQIIWESNQIVIKNFKTRNLLF